MKCKCGEELTQNAKFCTKCGEPVQKIMNNDDSEKNVETEQDVVKETAEEASTETTVNDEAMEESSTETTVDDETVEQTSIQTTVDDETVEQTSIQTAVDSETIIPTDAQKTKKNSEKSKKTITIVLIILAILIVGTVTIYYTKIANSIVFDEFDDSNYPFVTVTLRDKSGSKYKGDDFVIYQDDQIVKNIEKNSKNEYTLILDFSLVAKDTTTVSVNRVLFNNIKIKTDSEEFRVKKNVLQNTFSSAELYNEEYPKVQIITNINSSIFPEYLMDDIKLVILDKPFENNEKEGTNFDDDFAGNKVCDLVKYEDSGEDVILTFNLGEYDRSEKLYYTLAFGTENIKMTYKSFELTFPNLNNATTDLSVNYDSYPTLKIYGLVYDANKANITGKIDPNKISVTNDDYEVVESTAIIDESNRLIISIDAEASDSDNYSYDVKYQDNNYGFTESVYIDEYSLSMSKMESEERYNPKHRYEIAFADCTWYEASESAKSKGGYLARIGSKEEMNAITKVIDDTGKSKALTYWVGSISPYGDSYYWVDENLDIVSYEVNSDLWLPGEPSYYSYEADTYNYIYEDAVGLFYRSSDKKWYLNDLPHDVLDYYDYYAGKIAYVIEYDK